MAIVISKILITLGLLYTIAAVWKGSPNLFRTGNRIINTTFDLEPTPVAATMEQQNTTLKAVESVDEKVAASARSAHEQLSAIQEQTRQLHAETTQNLADIKSSISLLNQVPKGSVGPQKLPLNSIDPVELSREFPAGWFLAIVANETMYTSRFNAISANDGIEDMTINSINDDDPNWIRFSLSALIPVGSSFQQWVAVPRKSTRRDIPIGVMDGIQLVFRHVEVPSAKIAGVFGARPVKRD